MSSLPLGTAVLIAHTRVDDGADASTRDVLDQVALVREGLAACDIASEVIALTGPEDVKELIREPGTVVFNLIESPPGRPRWQVEVAAALEQRGLALTGSCSEAIWLTTDKIETRCRLAAAGMPVAPGGVLDPEAPQVLESVPPPWIIKPAWEDASLGLDGAPVVATVDDAVARARELARRFPEQPLLVEHLLPGRELSLSLLAKGNGAAGPSREVGSRAVEGALIDGVQVLPVAEMLFLDFAKDEPRVLSYEAKWHVDSSVYARTVRSFVDPVAEAALYDEACRVALAVWRECGLAGYARVDLRLDEDGRPCVLEANANPCLSADAGFMAAAARAGLGPADVVGRVVAAADGGRS